MRLTKRSKLSDKCRLCTGTNTKLTFSLAVASVIVLAICCVLFRVRSMLRVLPAGLHLFDIAKFKARRCLVVRALAL